MNTVKSEELYKIALDLMPGGVNSPVRAFGAVGRNPLFIDHAKGSYVYDVDGNKFIDYVCSWGPGILGHSHPEVLEEVVKACFDGLTFGAPTGKENELAQLVKDCVPSMEMMRMVSSGTEATMSAIRAARGFTGRDKIIKFKGCYHGHSDGLLVQAGSAALTQSVPDSSGVPASFAQQTLVALYNDKDSVRELFENNKDQIAALIVEPVAANMGVVIPDDDFLPFLREITEENGTILIFDEVITGFRLGVGGAQEWFGIKPDLSTFGKIVGGGMPMAIYGGRKDIMRNISPTGKVYQAGTLSGNPVAMAAGIAQLTILKDNPQIYENLNQKSDAFFETMKENVRKSGHAWQVNHVGSIGSLFFTEQPVVDYASAKTSDTAEYARYFKYMLDNGIHLAPAQFEAMFVSAAHTGEDLAYAQQKAEEFLMCK